MLPSCMNGTFRPEDRTFCFGRVVYSHRGKDLPTAGYVFSAMLDARGTQTEGDALLQELGWNGLILSCVNLNKTCSGTERQRFHL